MWLIRKEGELVGNIIKDDIYILHLFKGSILSPSLVINASFRVLFNFLDFLPTAPNIQWVGDGDPMIRI